MSTPVTLRGRLTRDPDMKFSAKGTAVATFAVVTSRRFKNEGTGEWEDRDTTFWDCVAFGSLAEHAADSLEKGAAVIVTGNAYQEEWEDGQGNKRRSLKVTVDDVAPSLRWASAKVSRAERQADRKQPVNAARGDSRASDSGYSDAPPF